MNLQQATFHQMKSQDYSQNIQAFQMYKLEHTILNSII